MAEAIKTAATIASLSASAVYAAKESVNRAFETTLAEGIRFERRIFHSLFATEDQKEGMTRLLREAARRRSRTGSGCAAAFRKRHATAALKGAPQAAVQPPSIDKLEPVICEAASEQRKTASAATWSTVTNCFVGCALSNTSLMT